MTDYEKLKKCFDEIGIEYRENKGIEKFLWIQSHANEDYIIINFDELGKFKEIE